MKVKVAAIRVVWDDMKEEPNDVIARGFKLAEEAAAKGAKYIVLPENFLYSRDPKDQFIPGPLTDRAVELAKKLNVYICSGIMESITAYQEKRNDEFDLFLSAILAGPEGLLSCHRKVDVEVGVYYEGTNRTDLDCWAGGDFEMHSAGDLKRIGIMICRDTFSNWAWARVLCQDPQIIFHPNLRGSLTQYGPNLPATANKWQVPVVAADGHPDSESMIVDRDGTIVDIETEKERVLIGEVTLADDHPNYVSFERIDNNPDFPVKFTKKI